MPMPTKIKFLTDGNEATLIEDTIDESGGDSTADYIYTKSVTKKGKTVEMSASRINTLIGRTLEIPKSAKWVSKKLEASKTQPKKNVTAGKTTTELVEMLKGMPQKKKRGSATGGRK